MHRFIASALLLLPASPALAQLRPVVDQPADAEAAQAGVDVIFVNDRSEDAQPHAPERIETTAANGTRLTLIRAEPDPAPVPPGGFARLRYVAESSAPPSIATAAATPPPEATTFGSTGTRSAFLDRFEAYQPIYGVFGAGEDGAKLQVSFAFRPFAEESALGGLRFAWTQTMFWRIDLPSGPFVSTNYSPEFFYQRPVGERTMAAIGYAHDSNGRDTGSIDANRIFVRVAHRFDLDDGWYAELVPQAWFYVGRQGVAPDLDRYWGYTSLGAAVGRDNGIRAAISARGNPATGKGGAELLLSYPLARLPGGPAIYLFGQGFAGYGEALDDYDRASSAARIGISLTR